MRKIIFNHKEINVVLKENYHLKRTHIRINHKGEIEIITNGREEIDDAATIVKRHKKYIEEQLDILKTANLPTFENDSTLWLLGKKYTVYRSKRIEYIKMKDDAIAIPRSYSMNDIELFLMGVLYDVVKTLTYSYIQKYDFEYMKVKLSDSKEFWGRCTYRKNYKDKIEYNIALVFVPFELVEYIVVHELCHTRQMNHSKSFWEEVEKIMPDAKQRRKILHKKYNADWYLEILDTESWRYKYAFD